jgi:hypothetical protein
MELRLTTLLTAGSIAMFSFVAGCSSGDTGDKGSGGTGGGSATTGGTGGMGAVGGSSAGMAAGGRSSGGAGGSVGGTAGSGATAGGGAAGGGVAGSSSAGRAAGGMGGAAAGGAASGGSGGLVAPPTLATVKEIFLTGATVPCNGSDCHASGNVANPFHIVLDNDDQLITNLTTTVVEECGNLPVVTPGHPESSAIVKLLNGPCVMGDKMIPQMPNGCSPDQQNCMPQDYIDIVVAWIQMGAMKN